MTKIIYGLIGIAVALSIGCSHERAIGGAAEAAVAREVMVSAEGVRAAEPAVAHGAAGAIFVVYVEHSEEDADVVVQKFDARGESLGGKVRVNPNAGTAKAWKGDPPTIAIGTDNTVFVGWTGKYADANAKGTEFFVSTSHDGGATFDAPVRVNDDAKPASHGMHSLAVGKDGRVLVAWLDERNVKPQHHDMAKSGHQEAEPNSEVFYSYSDDGGKSFAANKKIASEVCPCCKTAFLAADDGAVYAAWRQVQDGDHRHIAVASSSDAGVTFAEGVIVSDDKWQISGCPVSGAALASSTPGTLDVVWYTAGDAGQAGIYFTRSIDSGKTFGTRTLVSNQGRAGTLSLFKTNGKSVAVFPAIDGVIAASWIDVPTASLSIQKTAQRGVPAAVAGVSAFVRESKGKSSVWLSIG